MSIPPLASKADAVPFVEFLLSTPELWAVVDAFDDGPRGLAQRRVDLARFLMDGCFADPEEPDGELANAQAGRVLARWILDAPLEPTVPRTLPGRAGWLVRLAAQRWDFRQGRERDFIPARAEMMDPATADAVYALARAWGMLEPGPATGEFDHVIVLGGLVRANVNRPSAAADLIRTGHVSTGSVLGLAGERGMSPAEASLAARLHCPESTESGSLGWGLARAFGTEASRWQAIAGEGVQGLEPSGDPIVRLAIAPRDPVTGRPDTGSAFGWLTKHHGELITDHSRILSVTTAIYWIDGHIRLLQQMPAGSELVTTGSAPRVADEDDPRAQAYLSQHYLQEVKSALDALPGLLEWAGA